MSNIAQNVVDEISQLPPEMQSEVMDFVQFLKTKASQSSMTDPVKIAQGDLCQLLKEVQGKGLFSSIDNPAEWQKNIREDRPLPGRDL